MGTVSIPGIAVTDLRMTAPELRTLCAMYELADDKGYIRENSAAIGKRIGMHGWSIRRHVGKLTDLGYVSRWEEYRNASHGKERWRATYGLVMAPDGKRHKWAREAKLDAPDPGKNSA